jgi:hypothetical protein
MRKIKFSLLLILSASFIQAQSFKQGFIITLKGDTLNGFIEDGKYEDLSRSINFKSDKKSKAITTYNPNEISVFQFSDGDFFASEMVRFSSLRKDGEMDNIAEMRFLHRLYLNDKTSLFELNDNHARPLFLRKNDGTIRLLCLEKEAGHAYLEILKNELLDCENLKIPADLALNSHEIQRLLLAYDHCGEATDLVELPKTMAWGGISLPLETIQEHYKGLGKMLQFEYRPMKEGLLGNITLGAELLYVHADKFENKGDLLLKYEFKHLELGVKARFYTNEGGWLRPYIFLAGTYYKSSTDYYAKYPQQEYNRDYSTGIINTFMVRPGIGVHAQWKRHFLRFELALDGQGQPRLGYGFAL